MITKEKMEDMIKKSFQQGYHFQGSLKDYKKKLNMLLEELSDTESKLSDHQVKKLMAKEDKLFEKFFWEQMSVPLVVLALTTVILTAGICYIV